MSATTLTPALAPTLRFHGSQFGNGIALNPLDAKDKLGYDEWRELLADLKFVDATFTERHACSAFVLSRMRVMRENEVKGRARLLQLCQQDFYEALLRVCLCKALPTDAEVAASECPDAGVYLLGLQMEEGGAAWPAFLEAHPAPSEGGASQPFESALTHLLALIIRTIQLVTLGTRAFQSSSLELSLDQVKAFQKLGGRRSMKMIADADIKGDA